jgi:hypothetical protein
VKSPTGPERGSGRWRHQVGQVLLTEGAEDLLEGVALVCEPRRGLEPGRDPGARGRVHESDELPWKRWRRHLPGYRTTPKEPKERAVTENLKFRV